MAALYDLIKAQDANVKVSDKSWKLKFMGKEMSDPSKEEPIVIE